MTQSEQILEDKLVKQLGGLGYDFVAIKDETALLANLKAQLEKHNGIRFSDNEFSKILNHLNKGNVFDRAKTLRDKFQFTRDSGESAYIEFLNLDHWCQNQYQVTRQVSMEGAYKNRYDVTLLINGLPLVQIELKRRGLELKAAFNQINRYQRHTFWASYGLFQYVQLFVISNGVNTKYYANNRRQSFKQTFFWTDQDNKAITQLEGFAEAFLEKCHLSKMICKYIVLHESDKILMVLRPYQYYATEAIIDRVKNSTKNGYIWHTTGSGKTLTSFKASQVLMKLPQVHKVVFVVDRNDLDYQTTKEFNSFSDGSVDGTDNTNALVTQFSDTTKLIVTTIQKLNTAISKQRYLARMERLQDKRIVFIFDECHRSQFGETHKRIKAFFRNHQMFGFTGTPIFADNAVANKLGKRTTKELFDDCLHKYVITNAIKDENVLRFSIEYVGRYKQKEDSLTNLDIPVEAIDTQELLESPDRLEKIVGYMLAHHRRKTHQQDFTAMFCVSSVETLIKYYEIFKRKKQEQDHDLRIATIFSYSANEEDSDADGMIGEPDFDFRDSTPVNKHTREKLDEFIADYNAMFKTKFSTKDSQSFYNYYKDIGKRIKDRERDTFQEKDRVDILLVVNMFLTGFDAKMVNTLYVDKNLKHHGLIQAFSRTNRILNEVKSYGNIVCFRNLKEATDDAIALFSNPEAKEVILMQPYEVYVRKFNEALVKLLKIAPTIDSVNDLPSETEELEFVKAFRELMRLKNILTGFSDFEFADLDMEEQEFEDYKSKYLDIYDKVKTTHTKEKVSILDDVDFELELIHRDEINVAYILKLLSALHEAAEEEREKQRKAIIDLLGGEAQLRSKKELIEKFINENLPRIKDVETIPEEFDTFWNSERANALAALCSEEKLIPEKLQTVIDNYLFSGRTPLRESVVATLEVKPKLLERKSIVERVIAKILEFVDTFDDGMGSV
ncbi:MAG: type I restriction endonuclease subunit R [Lewinellaceae bacterium]|nr:type I restriction endonuclease subunit R [Lewinellaceae bacterium]